MCTSSMIYTLYFPACGAKRTWSTRLRISSTELLEAASSSWMFMDVPSLKEMQEWHWLQASPSDVGCSQLIVLARMRAQVVLPTPRGPQNRKAWASWWFLMAFFRVVVMCSCPTTVSKACGLYFRAETINFSITRLQAKTIRVFIFPKNRRGRLAHVHGLLTPFVYTYETWRMVLPGRAKRGAHPSTGCRLNSFIRSKR